MSYSIEIVPPARKEVEALPGYVRAQARQLIRALGEDPRPARSKELQGKPDVYCIWLARKWRIVYVVDDDLQRILILRVRRKEQIDYKSV